MESGLHWDTRAGESCSGQASSFLFLFSALCIIVAMAVYTSNRWSQTPFPQVQTFFSWSFYLGWASSILFLCAGDYVAHLPGEDPAGVWGGAVQGTQILNLSSHLCLHTRLPEPGCSLQNPPGWVRNLMNRRQASRVSRMPGAWSSQEPQRKCRTLALSLPPCLTLHCFLHTFNKNIQRSNCSKINSVKK